MRRLTRTCQEMIGIAAALATLSVGGGIAAAGSGGGLSAPDGPQLRSLICVERCAAVRKVAEGSTIRLDGRNLGDVDAVAFAGRDGRIAVAPSSVHPGAVEAKVPAEAVTGTVTVSAFGARAETPRDQPLEVVAASEIPDGGAFRVTSAEASPHRSYYDGARPPGLAYLFRGGAPTDVRIEVVERESDEVVDTWIEQAAEPNTQNTATWDGRTASGAAAANGEYRFRIASVTGGKAQTTEGARFAFHKYRFPIAARHGYGDGFGAGRNHQGQDVFAKCGTPLLAARGGRVQANKTHPAAGNYLVVDGKGTGTDFVYAHLQQRSPLRPGARVRTGQRIGLVGDSGNAAGCHLHFEVWSAPGWYSGGQPLASVARLLKAWDRWS
jgi:murein DD-endopeptidase MepM/ murein hydrolase activator NlpD